MVLPFYTCIPWMTIIWCTVPEIWCAMVRETGRQTDRQKKWHTGLSMNILHMDNISTMQRGFFKNSTSYLLPALGFLGGL